MFALIDLLFCEKDYPVCWPYCKKGKAEIHNDLFVWRVMGVTITPTPPLMNIDCEIAIVLKAATILISQH